MRLLPDLRRRFLGFAFHLLYHQLAWTYDLVAWLVSFGQWGAWRRTATLFLQEGPVLELGYGTGGFMADMATRDPAPAGLDLSPYMARLARRRLLSRGATPRLVCGQAQYLPFPDASFANVVATFPTEFILDVTSVAAIARVMRPGGRLIIVAMGHLKGPAPLRHIVDGLYRITGQRNLPVTEPIERLKEFGFTARWEEATLADATARLLVAVRG